MDSVASSPSKTSDAVQDDQRLARSRSAPGNSDESAAPNNRIRTRIEEARKRLVEITLKNRLINTSLESSRTRNLRIFGELSDQIFEVLVGKNAAMTFLSIPERSQSIFSENEAELDSVAAKNGEELILEENPNRNTDSALQTKLEKLNLENKLKALYYESKEYEEEQGVNVLYLALGFLKWFENSNSDVPRYAPLVLIPVELTREGARDRYRIKARDEDIFTNISLKLFLEANHSINLPDIPEEGEWTPSGYIEAVAKAVMAETKWETLTNEILLGFFSFSKFLLWRDLDPKVWPSKQAPHEHPGVVRLLSSTSERPAPSPPLVPADEHLDDHFTPRDLVYVLDADSSQTEAIQTALAGRDLTIQGPPGTGKSQTITNIIAAAVKQGKKVLFIAEKMAALDVVHSRLVKSKLGPICLQLHSRKASKRSIHSQIQEALDIPNITGISQDMLNQLQGHQDTLNGHARRVNEPIEPRGFSPYEVLGAICRLHRLGIPAPDFDIPRAADYTKAEMLQFKRELQELADRLRRSGVPCRHPWRMSGGAALSPFSQERLGKITGAGDEIARKILRCLSSISDALQLSPNELTVKTVDDLRYLQTVLQIAKQAPSVPYAVLNSFALTRQLSELHAFLEHLEKFRVARENVAGSLISGWETHNLRDLRIRFGGSGGSLFSILSSTYRTSVAELKGLAKTRLPRGFSSRLRLIDDALLASSLSHFVVGISDTLRGNLGPLWREFDTDLVTIRALILWIERIAGNSEEQFHFLVAVVQSKTAQTLIEILAMLLADLFNEARQLQELMEIPARVHVDTCIKELAALWDEWNRNANRANDWPPVRDYLSTLATKLGAPFNQRIWVGEIVPDSLVTTAEIAIYEKLWTKISARLPELAALDGYRLDQTQEQFRLLDKERLSMSSKEILASYVNTRPTGNAGEMGIIRQELTKKRNHLTVRRLLQQSGRAIQALKPVFLMSPLSVAQFIAPGSMMFDVVIIDEASQVRPEEALGAIARAKQIITVGDDKQLPPTNFFNRLIDDTVESVLDDDEFLGSVVNSGRHHSYAAARSSHCFANTAGAKLLIFVCRR